MTADRLAQIEQRVQAVTPGPWEVYVGLALHVNAKVDSSWSTVATVKDTRQGEADAILIARAPADLAWQAQRIRELEAREARVRAACFASDNGSEYAHNHGPAEGYPGCPACWAHHIRRALDGES